MRWPAYLRGVLGFSLVSVPFLYLLQRVQKRWPRAAARPRPTPCGRRRPTPSHGA
nr:hypothetical protein [Streptomyces niveus]